MSRLSTDGRTTECEGKARILKQNSQYDDDCDDWCCDSVSSRLLEALANLLSTLANRPSSPLGLSSDLFVIVIVIETFCYCYQAFFVIIIVIRNFLLLLKVLKIQHQFS